MLTGLRRRPFVVSLGLRVGACGRHWLSIPLLPVSPDAFIVCAVDRPANDKKQERTQADDLKPIHVQPSMQFWRG
jgi:hypothetical protein